jgi:ubiquinone/menaquinone biosynthesis C-methylase UbiE
MNNFHNLVYGKIKESAPHSLDKISFKKKFLQDYYFWDNTTVSIKSPLLDFVKDGMKILEIGTGPSSTLSRFLAKHKSNLSITATDISKNFLYIVFIILFFIYFKG